MPFSRSSLTCLYLSFTRVPSRNPPRASMLTMTLSLRSAMSITCRSSSGLGALSRWTVLRLSGCGSLMSMPFTR